ncbi:MAG: hypothetical protein JKY44_01480 [Flavobacteriaceae bacterium]|nr:hypothetical protein [Flavobacteriaceae bacterium]
MRVLCAGLILLLYSSCLLMPLGAPRYHIYKPTVANDFVDKVEVFDTPELKTYHFFSKKNLKIKGCSKIFIKDSCLYFDYEDFFEKKKYVKRISIRNGTFRKLLKEDTLKLFINGRKIVFVPVLK